MNDKLLIKIMITLLVATNAMHLLELRVFFGFKSEVVDVFHSMTDTVKANQDAHMEWHTRNSSNSDIDKNSVSISDHDRLLFQEEIKNAVAAAIIESRQKDDTFKHNELPDEDMDVPPELAQQREELYNRGLEIIENAVAEKNWSEQDNLEMIFLIHKLDEQQQIDLRKKFTQEVNRNKIEVKEIFAF